MKMKGNNECEGPGVNLNYHSVVCKSTDSNLD